MMETLTLSSADNQNHQTTLHVAEVLGNHHHHHHSPVDEEHMMNLNDMTDLSQEIEDIDGYVPVAKEVIFISLVSQEQALYNPKHENYRNTHKRDMKWLEIAERVGWTEMQCKSKWKAMRDQYCRELKRSKSNIKANIKWKYFKELDFLRPYALARNYRPRNSLAINSNLNSNNNNQNNNFNCSGTNTPNGISVDTTENNNSPPKFPTIKLESGTPTINFTNCDFSSAKSDTSNNLTEEQLTNVLQQQNDDNNWNYITAANSNPTANSTRLDNHTLSDTQHLLNVHHQHHSSQHQQQATDEAFYNALVDCVGQIQQQQQQQQQHEQQMCQQQNTTNQDHHQQQSSSLAANNNDEEDDDPIHTFLNIESYFEKELIALIRSEDVLYNSSNPNYRNVKLKLVIWDEIARKLKKTVKQCRLKWKALRDQFIREHKRLKNRNDIETLSKWKHYDALIFLQNFMKQKQNDFVITKDMLQIMPKTEIDTDITAENEQLNISNSSPLRTPLENIKCDLSEPQLQMQHITAVNNNDQAAMQHSADHTDNLCVNPGSVGGYDDMDIDNYIIGDSGSVVNEHNDVDNETDTEEDRKSQQEFSVFNNHNTSISNDMTTTAALGQTSPAFEDTQQQQQQDQQCTQHINMPSLDLNEATASVLINPDNLNANTNSNNSYQQNHLTTNTNNITLASAVSTLDLCTAAVTTSTQQQQQLQQQQQQPSVSPPTTCEASTNTLPLTDNSISSCSNSNTNGTNISSFNHTQQQDDDEVGAFFKAVAMKIRNAKLSPVAFTDLQIEILRVINSSLRNH